MKNKKKNILVFITFCGIIAGFSSYCYFERKRMRDLQERYNKFWKYYHLFEEWLHLREEGSDVHQYFENEKYSKIIIYGMGVIGNHLINSLEGEADVVCAIDRNQINNNKVPVIHIDDTIPKADVIVVTAIADYQKIEMELREKVSCPIVSMEDVVINSFIKK